MTIEARLTFATQLILEAGQLAARHFAHREDLTRETKGPQDFVSNADREVESLIRIRLTEAFPADGFLGEEIVEVAALAACVVGLFWRSLRNCGPGLPGLGHHRLRHAALRPGTGPRRRRLQSAGAGGGPLRGRL